jgi:hypothetical protein
VLQNSSYGITGTLTTGSNTPFTDTLAVKPKDFVIFGHVMTSLEFIYTVKQCINSLYRE